MNEDEIKGRFEAIERRLDTLENKKIGGTIKDENQSFSGLVGGIRLLIKNGFFNTLRDAKEVQTELRREGYHHEIAPISKILSVNFTKNYKILNRIKESGIFKYAIRK